MKVLVSVVLVLGLVSCGEPASTYDPERGRFRSTSEMRQEQNDRLKDLERQLDRLGPCLKASSNEDRADCLMQQDTP